MCSLATNSAGLHQGPGDTGENKINTASILMGLVTTARSEQVNQWVHLEWLKKAKAGTESSRFRCGVTLQQRGSRKVLSGVAMNLAFRTKSGGWLCRGCGEAGTTGIMAL